MKESRSIPRALTIAGSDSGGGAGVQADLKTFAAFGVYGTCAITAVTAQNTCEVRAVQPIRPEIVAAQIEAVVADIGVDAAKTGMLATRETVECVTEALARLRVPLLVVDPVMVSKSGARLLEPDAVDRVRERLLPLATLVTPNLPEAEILVGRKLPDLNAVQEAAREIGNLGPANVVIKGGHLQGRPVDILFDGTSIFPLEGDRVSTASDHGTGCTFSAAITAMLAGGEALAQAVEQAKRFVEEAMKAAPRIGSGHGPLDHFCRMSR